MKQSLVGRVSTMVLAVVVAGSALAAAPKKGASKAAPKGGASQTKPSAAQIAAGKKVFQSSGCVGCHKMDGKGGTSGPDLSHEGQSHDVTWITQKVKAPKSTNKDSIMPPFSGSPKDLAAVATYLASLK